MKRILFVDDEPHLLDGLRDLLRKQRKQWDMVFAVGGEAALEELEKGPFDVVVTDMRMPGIDGATLLARVKERYPASARIVLSGYAERESVVRALPVAHQFLSKPCDANLLRIVVQRACDLQGLLHDTRIRAVIGKLDKLPSVPHTYWELTRAAANPDIALADIADIVQQDPAIVVKLLQLVNSSYFGIARRISSVAQAVSYLGTDMLKALALTAHAFGTMNMAEIDGFSLEQVQRHSVFTANLCKRMVADPKQAGDPYTAAMVHDIGKSVLALALPEAFAEVVRCQRLERRSFFDIERELLGVNHAEVGAYLLGAWGLPMSIVEAVAYHHSPGLIAEGPIETLAMVHIANALALPALGSRPHNDNTVLDLAFVERAGMLGRIEEFRRYAQEAQNQERGS